MRSSLIAMVLAATSTATIAQWYPDYDYRSPNHQQYLQQQREEFDKRQRDEEARNKKHAEDMYGEKPSSPSGGSSAGTGASRTDFRALGKELLRLPPLPVERNVLLGNWRLEGGGQQSGVLEFGLTGRGATPGLGEMMGFMKSIDSGQLACDMSFGRGITFTPTTFSSGGAAGMAGGPVAYRSRKKGVIVAIPGDSRANPMFFEIVGSDRIKSVNMDCALVRVGAPGANAAANATTASGNARTAASGASAPPAAGAPKSSTAAANSSAPSAAALPQMASAAPSVVGAVADGAAFQCADGSLLHVSLCQGASADSTCKLTELHKPPHGLQMGTSTRRADIAARVKGCEAGGIRYGADQKAIFVR